jgi:hypothetical protein
MDTPSAIWFLLLTALIILQVKAVTNSACCSSIRIAGGSHRLTSFRSRARIVAACAAALTVAASTACAGEASEIATRGGFLVGYAYRCGVSAEQLRLSTQLVGELIAALSVDGEEEAAADQIFVDNLLRSLRATPADDLVTSSALIRRGLAELEQHQGSRLHPGSSSDVE